MKKSIFVILVLFGLSGCSANKSAKKVRHRETAGSFVRTQSDSLHLAEKRWTALKGIELLQTITLSAPDDSGRQYLQNVAWKKQKKPGWGGLWRNMGILAAILLIGYCLHLFTRKS